MKKYPRNAVRRAAPVVCKAVHAGIVCGEKVKPVKGGLCPICGSKVDGSENE